MFYKLRFRYYLSRYFNELKAAADSSYEAMKDFTIKMGSENLSKAFEITTKARLNKHKEPLSYEQFLNDLYDMHHEYKPWIINKYGIETYKLFLRAGGLDEKTFDNTSISNSEKSTNHDAYANEIQKHLLDLGCTFTTTGFVSAMALKHDRSALDQAISFCVCTIAENYAQLDDLIRSTMNGNIHLTTISNQIKNYYENGQISKHAYQSVISILGSCLNRNKTSEEKETLEALIKQNYLGNEKLVSIKLA